MIEARENPEIAVERVEEFHDNFVRGISLDKVAEADALQEWRKMVCNPSADHAAGPVGAHQKVDPLRVPGGVGHSPETPLPLNGGDSRRAHLHA